MFYSATPRRCRPHLIEMAFRSGSVTTDTTTLNPQSQDRGNGFQIWKRYDMVLILMIAPLAMMWKWLSDLEALRLLNFLNSYTYHTCGNGFQIWR